MSDQSIVITINDNIDTVRKDGIRSLRSLMGLVMKEVRGKASGKAVNELLTKRFNFLILD